MTHSGISGQSDYRIDRHGSAEIPNPRRQFGPRPSLAIAAGVIALAACSHLLPAEAPMSDWPVYGGPRGDRYSTLTQIDRSNVGNLREAWRVELGQVHLDHVMLCHKPGGHQTERGGNYAFADPRCHRHSRRR